MIEIGIDRKTVFTRIINSKRVKQLSLFRFYEYISINLLRIAIPPALDAGISNQLAKQTKINDFQIGKKQRLLVNIDN